jgi:hypothetical protein
MQTSYLLIGSLLDFTSTFRLHWVMLDQHWTFSFNQFHHTWPKGVMESVKGNDPAWSEVVQHSLRVRRELRELPVNKELASMLAGVVSLGTQSCANDKGPLRKEVGGQMT